MALAEKLIINTKQHKTKEQDDAFYAYLLSFDANDRTERKKLLKIIVQNPDIAVLFAQNCGPNSEELSMILESVLEDIDACCNYLIKCNPRGKIRKKLFNVIVQDADISYKAVKSEKLSYDEIRQVHTKHKKIYAKSANYKSYVEYCLLFKEHINIIEKGMLVKSVYKHLDKENAIKILDNISLNERLRDKLESILIIDNLSG